MYEGSNFVYDERRKELRGTKSWLIQGEEDIKKQLQQLETQKQGIEKQIEQVSDILNIPEVSEEQEKKLSELKELLTILQKRDAQEKKGEQLKEQLKNAQEDLAEIKKDIDKIKQAIGTRLNL